MKNEEWARTTLLSAMETASLSALYLSEVAEVIGRRHMVNLARELGLPDAARLGIEQIGKETQ